MSSINPLTRSFFFALILAGALAAAPPPTEKAPIRFFYGANRQGEIEPCDCQTNQIGGLNRLEAFRDETLAGHGQAPVFFGDAGDTFFSAPSVPPTRQKQEWLKARVIAKAYRLLRLDAFTPGERDFLRGWDGLKQLQGLSGGSYVAANLTDAKGYWPFEKLHIFRKGPWKLAVTGLVDPDAFAGIPDTKVTAPLESFRALLPTLLEKKPDVVVVLSHLGLVNDRMLARALATTGGIDLIFGSHSLDPLRTPERVGRTYIFQPKNGGEQIGYLEYLPRAPEPLVRHQLIDLGKEYDKPNAISRLIERYKSEVRSLALGSTPSSPVPAPHSYVAHARYCRSCHEKQYDFWEGTKHSSAYLVLYAKNQHFNPECIGCHSLGFKEVGGFQRIASPITLTAAGKKELRGEGPFIERLMRQVFAHDPGRGPLDSRVDGERYRKLKASYHAALDRLEKGHGIARLYIGVQCEHCHGNRSGHPGAGASAPTKVSEKTCRTCHAPPNAPDFNSSMFAKVACPRMRR